MGATYFFDFVRFQFTQRNDTGQFSQLLTFVLIRLYYYYYSAAEGSPIAGFGFAPSTIRAGATGTAGTAMAVPKKQKNKKKQKKLPKKPVYIHGTSKTGEKKFRCMILYRESPRVQDLPSKFQKFSGGGLPDPLKHGPSAAPLRGSCLRP